MNVFSKQGYNILSKRCSLRHALRMTSNGNSLTITGNIQDFVKVLHVTTSYKAIQINRTNFHVLCKIITAGLSFLVSMLVKSIKSQDHIHIIRGRGENSYGNSRSTELHFRKI
jgi:hypothetical protein